MPGTRSSILKEILAWSGDLGSPCVFWLSGLTGTGKSTIARTLCESWHKQGLLGASFFISRDEPGRREVSNVVRSIAHQLAVRWGSFSDALCAKLRETPVSSPRSLQEQISDFITTPARAKLQLDACFVIVIDALDECLPDFLGRPGGEFLLVLVRQLLQLGGCLKLFITSPAEIPIQHMFQELSAEAMTVVKLHDLDTLAVRDDITAYLTHSFAVIRKTRSALALGTWPSIENITKLAELSGWQFIYAATAVRFVQNSTHGSRARMAQLFNQGQRYAGTSPYGQLDRLYRHILRDAVLDPGSDEDSLCQKLRAVVAVIVLGQTPLIVNTLSTLSGVGPEDVLIVVGRLASLLVKSASGIRVFHPSFPHFSIDTARCTDPRLCVVPTVGHGMMALRCLELMNQDLRYDICNIQDPTTANKYVPNLDGIRREKISDALRYAVSFWCIHLAACGRPDGPLLDALDDFCQKHLFHWLEALSLVEYVLPAEAAVFKAIDWCQVCHSELST
jgi:hypothetical protein